MQAVRAEIKKWEKSFKARNGRNPTVDDIRAQADIADKYRLYKRLSKDAAATASAPKTPPKAPVLLPSSSRVAEATAPLATFNPFSPVKNKGKTRAEPALVRSNVTSQNPFSTPAKLSVRSASPCEPSTSRQQDASIYPAAPPTAITRARKRLRGEPVSPSPNKEKKQRVLPISVHPLELSDVGDDPSHPDTNELGSMTIGDSPAKPPAGNKSFTTLFQECLPPLVLEPKKDNGGSTAQTKNSTTPRHSSVVNALPSFDEELGWLKTSRVHTKTKQRVSDLKTDKRKAVVMKASTSVVEEELKSHIPLKRPLLDAEPDSSNIQQQPRFPPLIPPSPPPEEFVPGPSTSNQPRPKHNLTINSRKKVKFSHSSGEETGEETDGDPEPTIKIIDATFQRPKQQTRGDDYWDENLESDPDPILTYAVRSKAQGSPPATHPLLDNVTLPHEGNTEVDLPEKLRDVLALDMLDFKARDRHEERVVDSLLYNRRTVHYDPNKGGEIWDIGEDLHTTRIRWDGELEVLPDTDGDDEWEGEPVPWEIAEL